jgi:hypothetical protein
MVMTEERKEKLAFKRKQLQSLLTLVLDMLKSMREPHKKNKVLIVLEMLKSIGKPRK